MKAYGTRVTFRIMGISAFCVGFSYLLFNRLYIIPKHRRQEKKKKAIPTQQVAVKEQDAKGHANAAFTEDKS